MATYYTDFDENDVIRPADINSRLAELDAAIVAQGAGVQSMKVAHLYHTTSAGTDGGAAAATTWNVRPLNMAVDPHEIVTLDSNAFTPIAGDYLIIAQSCAYWVDAHRLGLHNGSSYLFKDQGGYAPTFHTDVAELVWLFTADGETAYALHHYTQTARGTDGLGKAINSGAETFAQVILIKF